MLIGLGLLIAINFTQKNPTLSLILFYAFAFCQGLGLAPTIGNYVQNFGPEIVYNAALTTGLGMFALAAIVYATGLDLRRFQGILNDRADRPGAARDRLDLHAVGASGRLFVADPGHFHRATC